MATKTTPKVNELVKNEEGTYVMQVLDEELDIVNVEFNNDGCATIWPGDNDHLKTPLSVDTLQMLMDKIFEAETKYELED